MSLWNAFILVLALIATAAVATRPAWAQETGTLITNRAAEIDRGAPAAARRTMEAFMSCLVGRYTGRATALTRLPIDSPQYERTFRNMFESVGDECIGSSGQLRFSAGLFRSGLFQSLYAREFAREPAPDFSAVTDTGYRQLYGENLSAETRTALALERFGECVSRADPEGVRSFLQQLPGAPGEGQAIRALMPRFSGCIPADQTITFSPSILKGAMAEGIYRLSVAARDMQRGAQ